MCVEDLQYYYIVDTRYIDNLQFDLLIDVRVRTIAQSKSPKPTQFPIKFRFASWHGMHDFPH